MLKLRQPLLPEWRYWPAIPAVVMVLIAGIGLRSSLMVPDQDANLAGNNDNQSHVVDRADFYAQLASYVPSPPAVEADATVLLAFITLGLVLLGIVQVRTTRRQLRAYVFVSTKVPLVKNLKTRVEIVVTNKGQTPAYAVEDRHDVWIDKYPAPIDARDLSPDADNKCIAIGPGDQVTFTQDVDLMAPLFDEVLEEKKAIYASIELTYRDTFKHRWSTKASFYLTGKRLTEPEDRRMAIVLYDAD